MLPPRPLPPPIYTVLVLCQIYAKLLRAILFAAYGATGPGKF